MRRSACTMALTTRPTYMIGTWTLIMLLLVVILMPENAASQESVNMDQPDGDDYCPMPKDPRNVMSYAFKEDTCRTYVGWCRNMDTHTFSPTSSQARWWDVLSVDEFYNYMEKQPSPRGGERRRGKRQAMSRRSVRRDYRLLSNDERNRFHRAVRRLKDSFMDGTRTYDIFVGYHQASMAPGAHFGPAFMPWHREFLLRFENALREIDPQVSLPYWDSSIDHVLGNSSTDSIMWTANFVGNGRGPVTEGPFANWPIPFESNGNRRLYRDLLNTAGSGRAPELFHDRAVSSIVDAPDYRSLTWHVDSTYESFHGATHNYIGGVMTDLANSPSDPMFFLHHAFLDCLFERMRVQHRAMGLDVNHYFPNDTSAMGVGQRQPDGSVLEDPRESRHAALATMNPFGPLRNIDGLRDEYTARYYQCAPSASCSHRNLDCGSDALFCSTANDAYRCAPRLRLGARCLAFYVREDEEANPCYASKCCDGVCSQECENSVNIDPEPARRPIDVAPVDREPTRPIDRTPVDRDPPRPVDRAPVDQEPTPPADRAPVDPEPPRRGPVPFRDEHIVEEQPPRRREEAASVTPMYTIPPVPTHGPFPTHPPIPTHPPSHFRLFTLANVTPVPPAVDERRVITREDRPRPPPKNEARPSRLTQAPTREDRPRPQSRNEALPRPSQAHSRAISASTRSLSRRPFQDLRPSSPRPLSTRPADPRPFDFRGPPPSAPRRFRQQRRRPVDFSERDFVPRQLNFADRPSYDRDFGYDDDWRLQHSFETFRQDIGAFRRFRFRGDERFT